MPFTPIPLGQPIPPGAHSVSCSLPTMRDVIGYEEKDPAITRHLTSGYPRFVQHPFLREAGHVMLAAAGRRDHQFWPTASARAAAALCQWLAPSPAEVLSLDGFHGVAFPTNADTHGRAKLWLQHCGRLASSRAAEDFLVRQGHRAAATPEALFAGDAQAEVHRYLQRVFAPATKADLFLANGRIVQMEGRSAPVQTWEARPSPADCTAPLIVLIDADSASAAEIVAGALQHHRRALLYGQPSYGKGTVQTVERFEDGSALKYTVARYLLPGGQPLPAGGLTPDHPVDGDALTAALGRARIIPL